MRGQAPLTPADKIPGHGMLHGARVDRPRAPVAPSQYIKDRLSFFQSIPAFIHRLLLLPQRLLRVDLVMDNCAEGLDKSRGVLALE